MDFKLKWLAWEITRRCNLDCVHCRSASSLKSPAGVWTLERAKTFLNDLAGFASPVVVLTGGEPLLHKNVFDIAAYGTAKGLRMALATNGTMVTDDTCQQIRKSGIQVVALSLDGASAAVHDNFRRQPGAFDAVIRAAGLFRKHNIPFIINSSFTKRNRPDLEKTFMLAKELGATAWYMFMIVPMGRAKEVLDELIGPEEYDRILRWHFEQEMKETDILMRPTCAPHYYRLVREWAREMGIKYRRRSLAWSTGGGKGCLAGQTIALVDAFGEVQPCSYFDKSAGNCLKTPLSKLWYSAPLLLRMRDFNSYEGRCGACPYIKVCGGCRARADVLLGSDLDEDPMCRYIPPGYEGGLRNPLD